MDTNKIFEYKGIEFCYDTTADVHYMNVGTRIVTIPATVYRFFLTEYHNKILEL